MEAIIAGVASPLILIALGAIGRWLHKIWREIQQLLKVADQLNHAVNNRPAGEPTIYELAAEGKVAATEAKEAAASLANDFAEHMKNDEWSFADLRDRVGAVDNAVNGRAPGEPTMSQDAAVSRLRDEAADAAAADIATNAIPGAADRAATGTADNDGEET